MSTPPPPADTAVNSQSRSDSCCSSTSDAVSQKEIENGTPPADTAVNSQSTSDPCCSSTRDAVSQKEIENGTHTTAHTTVPDHRCCHGSSPLAKSAPSSLGCHREGSGCRSDGPGCLGDGLVSASGVVSVGGLEYSFVDEVPDDYICPVCAKVLKEPHLTDCCGHHYCLSCLQHWITSGLSNTCPFCRSCDFNHIHDKKLDRSIGELKIKCPNSDQGCEWEGPICDLQRHLDVGSRLVKGDGCEFMLCECENMCGCVVLRKDLSVHLQATCPERKVECEDCKRTFTYKEIVNDHFLSCGEKTTLCDQHCGEVVKRREMERHREQDCPNQIVECPFADVGCTEQVPRKSLTHHISLCKEQHLTRAFLKMKGELSTQKEDIQIIKRENQLLREELVRLKRGVSIGHNNIDILHRHSNVMRNVITSELQYLHSTDNPCEILSLECVRTQVDSDHTHLQSGGRCATFRMPDYTFHKETGQVWYTPPFHISNGYAMCFGVHLNGVGAGKGTHVSLFLHQIPGAFDNEIKWPYILKEDFEVCVMAQERPEKHHSSYKAKEKSSTLAKMGLSPRTRHKFHSSDFSQKTQTIRNLQGGELELVNTTTSRTGGPLLSTRRLDTVSSGPSRTEDKGSTSRTPHAELSHMLVAESQVLCVTQTLTKPSTHSHLSYGPPVARLELFSLKKMVESVVYRDSIVLQCRLRAKQDTGSSCSEVVVRSRWEEWSGESDRD